MQTILSQMLALYPTQSQSDEKNALTEVIQEVALQGDSTRTAQRLCEGFGHKSDSETDMLYVALCGVAHRRGACAPLARRGFYRQDDLGGQRCNRYPALRRCVARFRLRNGDFGHQDGGKRAQRTHAPNTCRMLERTPQPTAENGIRNGYLLYGRR